VVASVDPFGSPAWMTPGAVPPPGSAAAPPPAAGRPTHLPVRHAQLRPHRWWLLQPGRSRQPADYVGLRI